MFVINKEVVNMYLKPSCESMVTDQILMGMIVNVLEKGDFFSLVETEYGYKGYLLNEDLINDGSWQNKRNIIITNLFADVFADAKIDSLILTTIHRATLCIGEKYDDKYYKVKLVNGVQGYVYASGVRGFPCDFQKERVVEDAYQSLNIPYRYGGKTSLGIDCSGLASIIYFINGENIYRDAIFKADKLKIIEFNQLKKGDLIYFKGHVAIYIGDFLFIHGSYANQKVMINSLDINSKLYDEKHEVICYATLK